MTRLRKLWAIPAIAALALWGCGGQDGPTPPKDHEAKKFTVVSATILGSEEGECTNSYMVGLTSEKGDYLSFRLTTSAFRSPSGTYRICDEAAHGAISDFNYSDRDNMRERGKSLALSLSPTPSGYMFSGSIATASGTTIPVSGSAALGFPRFSKMLIFSTLSSCEESSQGVTLNFDRPTEKEGESYSLSVTLPGAEKLADVAGGDYSLTDCPATFGATFPCLSADGGVTSGEFKVSVAEGTLHTSLTGNVLAGNFKWDNFDISFSCEVPGKEDTTEYTELTRLISSRKTDSGFISVKMAQEGVTVSYDPITWQTKYTGQGLMVDLEIHAPDGILQEGRYPAADRQLPGTFRAGWDPGDIYGIGVEFTNWGTCAYTLSEAGMEVKHITDGVVNVAKEGENYTVTIVGSGIAARYTGPITQATESGR